MTLLVVLVLALIAFGGSYGYGRGGAYPLRGYALPGLGTIVVVLVVLLLLGVIRL